MNKQGFSMIELMITAVVLCLVSYFIAKNYFGNSGMTPIDNKTKIELQKEGVRTDTLPGAVESAQSKVDEYNKRLQEREKNEKTSE
jgi:prepilin-type N-terminal cleavage/methylation domain-containing protein